MILGKQTNEFFRPNAIFGHAATLIRWEGTQSSAGTSPGNSTRIWETIFFDDGMVEIRIGNWASGTAGITGIYNSSGTGTSFSVAANTSYVFDGSSSSPSGVTVYSGYTYKLGQIVSGSGTPWGGASATSSNLDYSVFPEENRHASSTYPWNTLQNANADDAYTTVYAWQYALTVNFSVFGFTGTNTCYVGSNSYITWSSGSTAYSSLSATNPALNKIFIDAGDRSYQKVMRAGYLVF